MVLASFWFALMAVGIKYASNSFDTLELVFYRGLVSMLFMAIVVRARGATLRTPVPMMHVWRSTIGVLSLSAWFYAIAHLPLATAMTLNYMSGVWVAAFIVGGALLYGDSQKQGPLLGTVLLGFSGVVMTLRPTIDHNQLFAGVVGLLSGMGAALAYMQVTALGKLGDAVVNVGMGGKHAVDAAPVQRVDNKHMGCGWDGLGALIDDLAGFGVNLLQRRRQPHPRAIAPTPSITTASPDSSH